MLGGKLYKPTKYDKNFKAIFLENRNFNFLIKLPIIVGVDRTRKNHLEIFARTLDKGFERDWSVGLGVMLGDGHTENLKKKFSSVRNFPVKSHRVKLLGGMFYKPKKYDENLQSHFFRKSKF